MKRLDHSSGMFERKYSGQSGNTGKHMRQGERNVMVMDQEVAHHKKSLTALMNECEDFLDDMDQQNRKQLVK